MVKVQRSDLAKIITGDVQVLEAIAQEVMLYPNLCRHTLWPGVVKEFERTIFEEIAIYEKDEMPIVSGKISATSIWFISRG